LRARGGAACAREATRACVVVDMVARAVVCAARGAASRIEFVRPRLRIFVFGATLRTRPPWLRRFLPRPVLGGLPQVSRARLGREVTRDMPCATRR
jgi:hypothetical protein